MATFKRLCLAQKGTRDVSPHISTKRSNNMQAEAKKLSDAVKSELESQQISDLRCGLYIISSH